MLPGIALCQILVTSDIRRAAQIRSSAVVRKDERRELNIFFWWFRICSPCFNPLCASQELCACKLCVTNAMVMISNPKWERSFWPSRPASLQRRSSALLSGCLHQFSCVLGHKSIPRAKNCLFGSLQNCINALFAQWGRGTWQWLLC